MNKKPYKTKLEALIVLSRMDARAKNYGEMGVYPCDGFWYITSHFDPFTPELEECIEPCIEPVKHFAKDYKHK